MIMSWYVSPSLTLKISLDNTPSKKVLKHFLAGFTQLNKFEALHITATMLTPNEAWDNGILWYQELLKCFDKLFSKKVSSNQM